MNIDVIYIEKSYIILCILFYFRECLTILNNRKWENDAYKIHFESGVRTGIGAFNLVCRRMILLYKIRCNNYFLSFIDDLSIASKNH